MTTVAESDSAESVESMDIDDAGGNSNPDQRFQSYNKLIRFLPYSTELPGEADRDLAVILNNLTRAVQCQDLQIAAQICTANLNS